MYVSLLAVGGAMTSLAVMSAIIREMLNLMVLLAIAAVLILGLYALEMRRSAMHRLQGSARRGGYGSNVSGVESYMDYIGAASREPYDISPEIAAFGQGLPLADMLSVQERLNEVGYTGCGAQDESHILDLNGQYVQRTNNYRREYPDNCSAPLNEFVGAVYKPVAIGAKVPCGGQC
jgi:hypothetical protein